jgi:mannitol/fructose-specific phosphotransferase system IIA component (Ntr-type)
VLSPTEFLAEPDIVLFDLDCGSGEEAVRALHERLAGVTNAVMDGPKFLADLLARMKIAPVCIAEDIALPHARTTAVNRMVLGIARSESGIFFDPQHPAVRIVFLIGTPKQAVTEYLHVAATLARMLRQGLTRAALMAATDEAELRAALSGGVAARR